MTTRADGYTEEQIKAWCRCHTAPDTECPLHGGLIVEWQVFTSDGQPMGVEAVSEEFWDHVEAGPLHAALDYIEGGELLSIRRTEDPKAYLQYRLISPWHKARNA